jgi:hypothetical protein
MPILAGRHQKTLTAKDAKDAKENQGETNLDDKEERLPVRTRGGALYCAVLSLTFPGVPGVLGGQWSFG